MRLQHLNSDESLKKVYRLYIQSKLRACLQFGLIKMFDRLKWNYEMKY